MRACCATEFWLVIRTPKKNSSMRAELVLLVIASDDFDPIVMADGRILYTRWEHHGPINRFPLFFTNPDGRGTFTFFSPHRKRTFFHARELADNRIVPERSVDSRGVSHMALNYGVGVRKHLKRHMSLLVNLSQYTVFVGKGMSNFREFTIGFLVGKFWE